MISALVNQHPASSLPGVLVKTSEMADSPETPETPKPVCSILGFTTMAHGRKASHDPSKVCSDGWTKDHTHDEAFEPWLMVDSMKKVALFVQIFLLGSVV